MEAELIAPGTILADKFRVVRRVGSGGMGSVYEIVHELTEHRRALKLLNSQWADQPEAVERFLREASAAGRIGSPHIVETFDAGRLPSGQPYVVMELLQGQTLGERLERGGVLPVAELIDLVRQACEGVQAAHDAGIVHRDLKPENLFLIQRDGRPFVKLLDFGVSKFAPRNELDRSTVGSHFVGTPLYMSPEQLRGESVDGRSDVYALGVITYECATGTHPYPGGELTTLIAQVLEGIRRGPLSNARPDLPPGLSEIVERAMARDRTERIPSPKALSLELAVLGLSKEGGDGPSADSLARTLLKDAPRPGDRSDTPIPLSGIEDRASGRAPSAVQAGSIVPPAQSRRAVPAGASETSGTMVSAQPRTSQPRSLLVVGAVATLLLGGAAWVALSSRSAAEPSSAITPSPQRPVEPAPSAAPPPLAPQVEPTASAPTETTAQPHKPASAAAHPPPSATQAPSARGPTPHDLAGKGEFHP